MFQSNLVAILLQYERSRVARKLLAQLREERRLEEERRREEERRKEEERQRLGDCASCLHPNFYSSFQGKNSNTN